MLFNKYYLLGTYIFIGLHLNNVNTASMAGGIQLNIHFLLPFLQ